jgi:ribonuclease HI
MVLIKNTEYVYTDGSVVGNGKTNAKGGSGIFFGTDDPRNMAIRFKIKPVTVSRTEMYAVYKALEMYIKTTWNILNGPEEKLRPRKKIFIYSDSLNTVKTVNTWMEAWEKRGWKKVGGSTPENLDLIKAIHHIKRYYMDKLQIKLLHVRSHQSPPSNPNSEGYLHWYGNYMADKLAAMGRRSN